MKRRDFIRFLLSTPIAATLDVEKMLWIPEPFVTVPGKPKLLSLTEILEAELLRIQPRIQGIFESDNALFHMIKSGKVIDYETGPMRVPLIIKQEDLL